MTGPTVAVVFARGGSKGLPGKNLRLLDGRPLVAWAVATARSATGVDRVLVSTDDPAIADAGRQAGGEVPWLRPPELATDDAPEWLAWQHAIRWLNDTGPGVETLLSVPPTAPLRDRSDVEACLELRRHGDFDAVVTVTPARRHPSFNMLRLSETGAASLVMPPAEPIYRRQDATAVYDMTTVAYAARADWVLGATSIFDGRVGAVVVPAERAIDIDDELDLRFAELLVGDRAS